MFRMSEKELMEKRPVYIDIESPIGPLRLVATHKGLRGLLFKRTILRTAGLFEGMEEDPGHRLLRRAENQLGEYFRGVRRGFDLPLDLEGTPFQRRVWEILLRIPYGGTVSYQDVALDLGDPRKARPVGGAVGANPVGIVVPCHRVLGKKGALTGFGGGLEIKTFLLNLESGGTGRP